MIKDMTKGAITPILLKFTIPLVLGNILQLFYNAVDSIIVGRFLGPGALAAVGTSNPIMTMGILFINGLCIGASVIMSTLYGAGKIEKLKRQISTAMISGSVFSIFVSAVFIIFADNIFEIIQTPADIKPLSVIYLQIIFCGMFFTFIYNFYASALRALGDSKSPLLFLAVSSVLNILGDLFFIVILNFGIEGCAISTVICEAISCLLCIIYVRAKVPMLNLGKQWLVIDKELFWKTVNYSWPAAMQQAIVPFGKIIMQGLVNTMGTASIAAIAAVSRVDDFACIPQQNIAHGMTAFMAQNRGAKKHDRVLAGFKEGMSLELIYGIIVSIVGFLCSKPIVKLFSNNKDVIYYGVLYMNLISLMYILPGMTNGIQGFFRGMGEMKLTLKATSINIGTRCLASVIFVLIVGMGIRAIPFSYMVGWLCMLAFEVPILINRLVLFRDKCSLDS